MRPPVLHDNNGFTLIEFMVALLILTVGLMGLLEAIGVSIRHNSSNRLRDEAIMLAEQTMSQQRVRPFSDFAVSGETPSLRTVAFVNYSVNLVVGDLTTNSKTVAVNVTWRDRGQKKTHTLSTVISNENN